MKSPSFHHYKEYLFILIFAILAYWPVSFMIFSAKNDAINYFLAMRYNTSEAIQHGIFPAWSPYINLGYPLHGDIQSGVWNPLVTLMSLVRQYDIFWLHTEIILINVIAGIGMYKLLFYLKLEKRTALLIALAYLLNGYMTDSGQFLNWLYAGAILPFVVLYAHKALKSFSVRDGFALGLAFSMLFLCGYPADTILAGYLLLAWFIVSMIFQARFDTLSSSFKKHLKTGFTALISFSIICLPAIISFMEFFPLVRRGAGVSLELAQSNSLAPANLLSLVFPWVTMKGSVFAATDPLIRNCYIGLIPLVFLAVYFTRKEKKDLFQKFLIGVAIFFLLFSLGKYGFLRSFLYNTAPLMDSFRHPANAKLFFMFAAQVLSAFALNKYILSINGAVSRWVRRILYSLFFLSLAALTISLIQGPHLSAIKKIFDTGAGQLSDVIKQIRDEVSWPELLFANSIFTLFIVGTAILLLKREKLRKLIIPLLCLDMFISAQLMLPLTYVKNAHTWEVHTLLNAQPKGYPIPDLNQTLADHSKNGMAHFELIGCLNPYNKKPGRSDYIITPSNLLSHDLLWEDTVLKGKILNYPFVFISDTLYPGRSPDGKTELLSGPKAPGGDQPIKKLRITEFLPTKMKFQVETSEPGYLVILQNEYPRWKARINKTPATIIKTDRTFMSMKLEAGTHYISFDYQKNDLLILTLVSILFVITGLVYYYRSKIRTST